MPYSIFVFNQIAFSEIPADALKSDLMKVSFTTLCTQYGLDHRLVAEAQENLAVLSARSDVSPFFLVRYQTNNQKPIAVFQHMVSSPEDGVRLEKFINNQNRHCLIGELERTCCIFRIDLEKSQLLDLGLLIGYEIARWLAFRGRGLVRDLQGAWYRINVHQAFIPLSEEYPLRF